MQDDPNITLAIDKTIMTIVRGDMLIDGTENDDGGHIALWHFWRGF